MKWRIGINAETLIIASDTMIAFNMNSSEYVAGPSISGCHRVTTYFRGQFYSKLYGVLCNGLNSMVFKGFAFITKVLCLSVM